MNNGDALKKSKLHSDSGSLCLADTVPVKTFKQKQADVDNKTKIKEVARAKRQPKPEKVAQTTPAATDAKPAQEVKPPTKPKRQRRPDGLERPPEIPRRNGN